MATKNSIDNPSIDYAFEKNGVIYVPHVKDGGFAYPGHQKGMPTLSEKHLVNTGAKKIIWKRT